METLVRALHELTHALREELKSRQSESGFRCHAELATKRDIDRLEKIIMATQKEATEQVNQLTTQVVKIGTEIGSLKQKIVDLETALENQTNVTPELQAAVDALKSQVQVVDDLVPDAPVPPPVP